MRHFILLAQPCVSLLVLRKKNLLFAFTFSGFFGVSISITRHFYFVQIFCFVGAWRCLLSSVFGKWIFHAPHISLTDKRGQVTEFMKPAKINIANTFQKDWGG